MLNFIKEYYSSYNTTISIYGKIYKKTLDKLKTIQIPVNGCNKRDFFQYKPLTKNIVKIKKDDLEQSIFSIAYLIPGKKHKDRYGLDLLAIILSGNMSSYLYKILREDKGLVYNIDSGVHLLPSIGYLSIYGACNPKNVKKTISIIFEQIEKLKKKKISNNDLTFFTNYVESLLTLSTEDSNSLLEHYIDSIITHDKLITIKSIISEYKNISVDKLQALAIKYFTNYCIVITGNHNKTLEKQLIDL